MIPLPPMILLPDGPCGSFASITGQVEPLPEDIPPDMYSFEDVQSDWERKALEELKAAPSGGAETAAGAGQGAKELPPPPSLKKAKEGAAGVSVGQSAGLEAEPCAMNDPNRWVQGDTPRRTLGWRLKCTLNSSPLPHHEALECLDLNPLSLAFSQLRIKP